VKRSTRTTNEKKARSVARQWEAELNAGGGRSPRAIAWTAFRERYENEVLSGLAESTTHKVSGVFNAVENVF
jgi:hypothetical protein